MPHNDEPAFPVESATWQASGMTLRQYAAIKLRVPESGDEWLDDMIRKSLRDYFAAKCAAAMASTIRSDDDYFRAKNIAEYHGMASVSDWFAHDAYKQADAMLRAREQQP